MYSDEACTNPITSGITATLRNETISDGILETGEVNIDGEICFGLREGDFANDTYEGVDLGTEKNAETNGTSTFYIRVNDPDSQSYNSSYETIDVGCDTPDIYGGNYKKWLPSSN